MCYCTVLPVVCSASVGILKMPSCHWQGWRAPPLRLLMELVFHSTEDSCLGRFGMLLTMATCSTNAVNPANKRTSQTNNLPRLTLSTTE